MPKSEFLRGISRLEAVERRWLWNIFSTLIIGSIVLAIAISHFDISGVMSREPVAVPPTQFLMIMIGTAIIVASSIMVLVEYFAFELRVERAVVIKKRRRHSEEDEINEPTEEAETETDR